MCNWIYHDGRGHALLAAESICDRPLEKRLVVSLLRKEEKGYVYGD